MPNLNQLNADIFCPTTSCFGRNVTRLSTWCRRQSWCANGALSTVQVHAHIPRHCPDGTLQVVGIGPLLRLLCRRDRQGVLRSAQLCVCSAVKEGKPSPADNARAWLSMKSSADADRAPMLDVISRR